MGVALDSPHIANLRKLVEEKFGREIKSRSDFAILVDTIEKEINEHIGENTLRRIWGNMPGYKSVFTSTLDVLSRYCGHKSYTDLCNIFSQEGLSLTESLIRAFRFRLDQYETGLYHVPRYLLLKTLESKLAVTEAEINAAVRQTNKLKIVNLAEGGSREMHWQDCKVLVNTFINTDYGCCIDRGSKITIVQTSGLHEPINAWFAYHVAKFGRFNFVAKYINTDTSVPLSFYNIKTNFPSIQRNAFLADINRLCNGEGSWVIPFLEAYTYKSRTSSFHFCYNSKRGDESYGQPDSRLKDYASFDAMYQDLCDTMKDKYSLACDRNKYYSVRPSTIAEYLDAENVVTLRIASEVYLFNNSYLALTRTIAEAIKKHMGGGWKYRINHSA